MLSPFNAALCICSLGSLGLGRVVRRYACATTSAASGVFGRMFPCSSTDRKDESRFLEMLRISEYSRFSYLEPCRRFLLALVCDVSLRALRAALLAAMADSFLCFISIFSFASCFAYCLRA
jgi:hypothetical protein